MTNPLASQQPAPIPDEDEPFYGNSDCAKCKTHLYGKRTYSIPSGIPPARMIVCKACAYPVELREGAPVSEVAITEKQRELWSLNDRDIARKFVELEAALTALRDFMWSEGYADQTAVMRQADAALGTPGREKP